MKENELLHYGRYDQFKNHEWQKILDLITEFGNASFDCGAWDEDGELAVDYDYEHYHAISIRARKSLIKAIEDELNNVHHEKNVG